MEINYSTVAIIIAVIIQPKFQINFFITIFYNHKTIYLSVSCDETVIFNDKNALIKIIAFNYHKN